MGTVSETVPLESSRKRAKRLKLGIDVHADHHVVVRQIDEAAVERNFALAQSFRMVERSIVLALWGYSQLNRSLIF